MDSLWTYLSFLFKGSFKSFMQSSADKISRAYCPVYKNHQKLRVYFTIIGIAYRFIVCYFTTVCYVLTLWVFLRLVVKKLSKITSEPYLPISYVRCFYSCIAWTLPTGFIKRCKSLYELNSKCLFFHMGFSST